MFPLLKKKYIGRDMLEDFKSRNRLRQEDHDYSRRHDVGP